MNEGRERLKNDSGVAGRLQHDFVAPREDLLREHKDGLALV